MNHPTPSKTTLRTVAALLLVLPALVAAACFAHGHGALSASGLFAALATVMTVAVATVRALLIAPRPASTPQPALVPVRIRRR